MRTIDLFSGCGGMSLGFQNAGFDIIHAFDNWGKAVETYKRNFNHPITQLDLGEIADNSIFKELKPEMIIGGPPCQDFSSAGKRNENLGRADLTVSFASLVVDVSPEWFVMENVSLILKSNVLKQAKEIFKKHNYGLSECVLDASLCGVPQARKRYFLIGQKNGKDNTLTPFLQDRLADKQMTVYDYFGDSLGVEYYYRHPRSYQRRGIFSIHEPSPTIRGVNRPIPKGYKKHVGDPVPPKDVRPLTTIERSYIQTFPKDFVFEGAKTYLEQMIGNAVPVRLAEYVANSILNYQSNNIFRELNCETTFATT